MTHPQEIDDSWLERLPTASQTPFGVPSHNAQAKKIFIACHQQAPILLRQLPHNLIRPTPNTKCANMERFGIQIGDRRKKGFGNIFVQEQSRKPSGSGSRQGPTLAFSGIREAGQHILVRELRKTGQDFCFRHTTCQISQHFADSESSITDAGFAEANSRINTDGSRDAIAP